MEIEQSFNKLIEYDLANVFNVGLFNRFKNCERRYLDHISRSLVGFIDILDQVQDVIKPQIGDDCFICIRTSSYSQIKDLNKEILPLLELGVKLPDRIIYKQLYNDDDELYYCYSFFEWKNSIKPFLWLNLSNNYPNIKPIFDLDLFFISKDISKIINVYDDRGIDILNFLAERSL